MFIAILIYYEKILHHFLYQIFDIRTDLRNFRYKEIMDIMCSLHMKADIPIRVEKPVRFF